MSAEPRRPTFLYVGAAKAGSFWLYEVLREHPDVFVPDAREVMFFDRLYDKGLDFYLRFFEGAGNATAVGEICHDYFLSRTYAERIRDALPDARVLCCLREPVDRALSEYLYDRTLFQHATLAEYRAGLTFQEFARRPPVRRQGAYRENLEPFFELFPREKVLVVFFDDLRADAQALARRIYSFLGVDPAFPAEAITRRVNAARAPRSDVAAAFAYQAAQVLRRLGAGNLIGRVKRSRVFERTLYGSVGRVERPSIPLEDVDALWDLYHAEDEALAELLGRPLPPSWSRDEVRRRLTQSSS